MPKASKSAPELQTRLRVVVGDEIALGPGKADLLEQIAKTGSIAEAAKNLDMSYMRAWTLVKTMNAIFRTPLVIANRGGSERGGAALSDDGQKILTLYRDMQDACLRSSAKSWETLKGLLVSAVPASKPGRRRMKK